MGPAMNNVVYCGLYLASSPSATGALENGFRRKEDALGFTTALKHASAAGTARLRAAGDTLGATITVVKSEPRQFLKA